MKCSKCKKEFEENEWEKGITYEGLDRHHNPPEFLSNFLNEMWSGEFYYLCRKCHKQLHKEIIKILNKKLDNFKFINSEYWTLKRMNLKQIKEVQSEIQYFTKKWVKEVKNGDTKTN